MAIYSRSSITNVLLNLIKEQVSDNLIDKIYLYTKDLNEPKYQFLIKKREDIGIKHLNDSKSFIGYTKCMDDVYDNIDDYNPVGNRKISIVFDHMIADIMANKKFPTTIKEIFIRCRKSNISLVFITQSYFLFQKKLDQIQRIT